MSVFKLKTEFSPAGDQPKAIKELVTGIKKGLKNQTLLGVTGSGKTFTVANVIAQIEKPTLVIAHNKTLAAQLASEFRDFFPENAVHYFVSYYDYYQPEAYMAHSDTYIEKEAQINEEIDRLRHATTQALLTRKDVIIIASVSAIYGLGSPEEYEKVNLKISVGNVLERNDLGRLLIGIHYDRTTADLAPAFFRMLGNSVEIMPVSERIIYKVDFVNGKKGSEIAKIVVLDAVTREIIREEQSCFIFPAKHFISSEDAQKKAVLSIKKELEKRLKELEKAGKNLEAERLKRRTNYDLALIKEVGYCNGIENYSRHFSDKKEGEAPDTLLAYFPHKADGSADFLTVIDESHVTIPQIGGMYAGDASRKNNLVEYGFRLPSARDNRPLKFDEFEKRIGQALFVSATPARYEKEHSDKVIEQVIRPTGLIDPMLEVRGVIENTTKGYGGQVKDFIQEAEKTIAKGFRVIGTTLTKKMAEDLTDFLKDKNIKAEYLHSDIDTLERIQILTNFRKGTFDVLIGVNLLREGIDIPELAFIGIFDADKEGFLRSETSLIQIIGRAARNTEGKVVLYADSLTNSLESAINETSRRRKIQIEYNTAHNITPKTIKKNIKDITDMMQSEHQKTVGNLAMLDSQLFKSNPEEFIERKRFEMDEAVARLDFETAAIVRDEITELVAKSGLTLDTFKKRKKASRFKR